MNLRWKRVCPGYLRCGAGEVVEFNGRWTGLLWRDWHDGPYLVATHVGIFDTAKAAKRAVRELARKEAVGK